jgi:MATE family multidrug resistance protein
MALCFGGESFLFFILSFISKNLGENNLSAYQASLHFISIIYMISIGIGNATGLIAARHFTRRDLGSLKKTYIQGLKSGLLTLAPFLLASVLWKENISMTYTSDSTIRKIIETNTLYSIPFLTFEFVYVLTRTILRSMDDFWAPTLLTILTLNIFGIALCAILLNFYHNIHSIFITLTICSFILMLTMFWRLKFLLKIHSSQPIGKL